MKFLAPTIKQRFFDDNGDPLAGGKVYTYAAGSTTPKATYKDVNGVGVNTNPIILNANGECDIWLVAGNYKIILTDSNDVEQWSVDYVSSTSAGGGSESQTVNNVLIGGWFAPEGTGAEKLEEFGFQSFRLPNPNDAEAVINKLIKIPENYSGGDIEVRIGVYTPNYSTQLTTNHPTVNLSLLSALIKAHEDEDTGYQINDLETSETTTVQVSCIPATFQPDPGIIIDGKPYVQRQVTFVFGTGGLIDGAAITQGSSVFLQLQRIPIVEDEALYVEDTESLRVVDNYMEVVLS